MTCLYCSDRAVARRMCRKHYMRWQRHGNPHTIGKPRHPQRIVLPVQEMISRYEAGWSLRDLAYNYYVSAPLVADRLRAAGCQLRPPGSRARPSTVIRSATQ